MAIFIASPKTFSRQTKCRSGKPWKTSMKAAGALILLCAIPWAFAWAKDYKWIVGRLVSAEIAGHGPGVDNKTKTAGINSDIWWTYRITAGDMTHLAVTRESPSRIGIEFGVPIRFAFDKKSIFIRDSSKFLHSLKILRSGPTKNWR